MKRIVNAKIVLIVIFALVLGVVAMPNQWKEKIPHEAVRNYLLSQNIKLGLDLAGGRQLDWKIDLSKVRERNNDDDPDNDVMEDAIVDGVAETLRRRIDPDGTRELVIQTSEFADERHVIVELTADIDNEETRAKLQKNIDLQFKELKTAAEEEDTEKVKKQAEDYLSQLKDSSDFAQTADKIAADNKNVTFESESKFKDELEAAVAEKIWEASPSEIIDEVLSVQKSYMYTESGLVPVKGFSIFKVGEKVMEERELTDPGEDFEKVRAEISDIEVAEVPVTELDEAFQQTVLTLETGKLSEVLENEQSYGIFKVLPQTEELPEMRVAQIIVNKSDEEVKKKIDEAYERLQEKKRTENQEKLSYEELYLEVEFDSWKETELTGQYFKVAKVSQNQFGFPIVSIDFNAEGAKLFEEITERNIGQPVAIYVGGELISAPRVNEKISGGSAQITFGTKNFIEAKKEAIALSRDLNAGAIPAPIELSGEVSVEASLGADALEASIKAGLIGFAVLAVWMLFFYRVSGLIAILALTLYSIIIIAILKTSGMFVLTLAGVAGIVLSIGMAVDANILIFERINEELKDGKNFSAALTIGFERAWTSIRDSNMSSLITCAILWWFGTSIIKGFAVMLALGIVISMFTAITVTKTLMAGFVGTNISAKTALFTKK